MAAPVQDPACRHWLTMVEIRELDTRRVVPGTDGDRPGPDPRQAAVAFMTRSTSPSRALGRPRSRSRMAARRCSRCRLRWPGRPGIDGNGEPRRHGLLCLRTHPPSRARIHWDGDLRAGRAVRNRGLRIRASHSGCCAATTSIRRRSSPPICSASLLKRGSGSRGYGTGAGPGGTATGSGSRGPSGE